MCVYKNTPCGASDTYRRRQRRKKRRRKVFSGANAVNEEGPEQEREEEEGEEGLFTCNGGRIGTFDGDRVCGRLAMRDTVKRMRTRTS